MIRAGLAAALVFLTACQPNSRTETTPATLPAEEGEGFEPVDPTGAPDSGGLLTVRRILEDPSMVGEAVRVSGRCLGYSVSMAAGPPPRTRSDWQLEDDGVAVYVSGTLPEGCSATEGSAGRDTIVARVERDSIQLLGNSRPAGRSYLIRMD